MKIILSRKGFDSGYGKCPSPILPDGTLLSMPIPSKNKDEEVLRFSDISYNGVSYDKIWSDISPKAYEKYSDERACHLDPDIRSDLRNNPVQEWKPAFGQCSAAAKHLDKQNVDKGDVFLFFGWFKQTEFVDGKFRYVKNAPDLHIIYGYMQIGDILREKQISEYTWHPHSFKQNDYIDNRLYVPTEKLIIDGTEYDLPGSGVFNFQKKYILTKDGFSRRIWEVPEWFKETKITYHSEKSFKETGFLSACRGQEFVIEENNNNAIWLKDLIVAR